MKEKEPKIASFRNATTIYMGHANGQDGEWDLFYSVHFEDRAAERKCSVEKAGIILGTIFEDAIFADKVSEDIVLSRASRRQSYDYVEKRQRFQILDMVNKVSFILELYPRTKEIYAITVLTQDREAINKKRNTVVIKILPAVEREDVVESKVVYYDYDLRIRAFKKLYEQVMDASCLPCED
jgi:hypothetical protein